jgi:hypothetical protein
MVVWQYADPFLSFEASYVREMSSNKEVLALLIQRDERRSNEGVEVFSGIRGEFASRSLYDGSKISYRLEQGDRKTQ